MTDKKQTLSEEEGRVLKIAIQAYSRGCWRADRGLLDNLSWESIGKVKRELLLRGIQTDSYMEFLCFPKNRVGALHG